MLSLILHHEILYLELLTRNADPDKYSYYQFGKEAMIFGADNSPYLCAY